MKNKFFLLLFISMAISELSFAQHFKNFAKNEKVIVTDEQLKIRYDLPRTSTRGYHVSLRLKNQDNFSPTAVFNTGEDISAGNGKEIIWIYTADDFTRSEVEALKFEVLAANGDVDRANETLSVASGGGVGLGMLIVGLITFTNNSTSHEHYKIYEGNTNPDDTVWRELGYNSRQDLYNTLNGKYQAGQWMSIGGALVVGGGYILFNSLKRKNDDLERKGITFVPVIYGKEGPIRRWAGIGPGVKVQFRF